MSYDPASFRPRRTPERHSCTDPGDCARMFTAFLVTATKPGNSPDARQQGLDEYAESWPHNRIFYSCPNTLATATCSDVDGFSNSINMRQKERGLPKVTHSTIPSLTKLRATKISVFLGIFIDPVKL